MQALCDECAAKPHKLPAATPYLDRPYTPGKQKGLVRIITLTPATAIPARALHFLYYPYLPLGKVAILAGPPDQGKSQLSLFIAAAVTRGELPGDVTEPGDVVIISAEDDPEDTIIPRLGAVGADFNRVFVLSVRERETDGSLLDAALALPTDGAKLKTALSERRVRLVIVDPISAFLDAAVDAHKNAPVRRALQPLKVLAEALPASVLAITHLSKGVRIGEPLDRVIDSVAFSAVARSVMLMSADPDDEQGTRGKRKVMLLAKANLVPAGEYAQRFEMQTLAPITTNGRPTSRVTLLGAAPSVRAGDLLMPPEDRSELGNAVEFLRSELAPGWKPTTDVVKAAGIAGIAERAVKQARQILCGRAKKERAPGGKWWIGLRDTKPPWIEGDARVNTPSLTPSPSLGPKEAKEANGGSPREVPPSISDETAHLRHRDAMLGEPWEDDE